MKFILVLAASLALFVLSSAMPAGAQNCPYDWHTPPCGPPPPPVKSPLLPVIKNAERYHWEAATLFGVMIAAACGAPVGDPRIDKPRQLLCRTATIAGAVAIAAQQWEKRLIEEINAARDGTQFVAMLPLSFFEVNIDTEGDPYLENLREHGAAIELIGGWIVDSVRTTFDCDAWAQYDVRGIECGDNQRAWTDMLMQAIGERYSAVSLNTDILVSELDVEVISEADFAALDYDAEVNGWEGWWMQQ